MKTSHQGPLDDTTELSFTLQTIRALAMTFVIICARKDGRTRERYSMGNVFTPDLYLFIFAITAKDCFEDIIARSFCFNSFINLNIDLWPDLRLG
jgi:hypothetical protein